jgi:outer membrane protein assembly factor BamB
MSRSRTAWWLTFGVLGLVLTPSLRAGDGWPQWRGPGGQGHSDDSQVPLRWSSRENLLWKADLPGFGNSTPIIWGDRIFLTAASTSGKDRNPRPDERHVLCVRASDGNPLWDQVAYKGDVPDRTHDWNGYASASCATDGARVYAFFGTPGLFCYDVDGKLLWKHSFGVFTSQTGWGTAASPFLFEDLVIQNCDNDGPAFLPRGTSPDAAAPMALIALDKETGKERWRAERNQGRGFSTPLLVPMPDGRVDLVLNGPRGVWAYDPHTGKEVWHCERHDRASKDEQSKFGEPLPVFNHDTLFAASGRPGPFQAIRLGGSKPDVLWEASRKGSRDVSSPLLWQDRIYAADKDGTLACLDAASGKILFKERLGASAQASPVAVRGKLLYLLENGETVVLEPAATYKEVGRNTLEDGTSFRASPSIVDGRLFLRSQAHLFCIGEKK